MGRKKSRNSKKRNPGAPSPAAATTPQSPAHFWHFRWMPAVVAFLAGIAATLILVNIFAVRDSSSVKRTQPDAPVSADLFQQLLSSGTWRDDFDLARVNLICAAGLPGAEELDVTKRLRKLDSWAEHVRSETERHLDKFYENPEEYENSISYFRMLTLISVLQQDCGVHYNEERIEEPDFANSQDLFLHGLIGSDNGGTCVSMPMLYTAVARRLDYPVKLVLTQAHVFCRWDGQGDRFNIEGAGRGMNCYPDDYYKSWPMKISDAQVKAEGYLQSLTPEQEIAECFAARGHCLEAHNRYDEAIVAYAMAKRLAPTRPTYAGFLQQSFRMQFETKYDVRRRHAEMADRQERERNARELERLRQQEQMRFIHGLRPEN